MNFCISQTIPEPDAFDEFEDGLSRLIGYFEWLDSLDRDVDDIPYYTLDSSAMDAAWGKVAQWADEIEVVF